MFSISELKTYCSKSQSNIWLTYSQDHDHNDATMIDPPAKRRADEEEALMKQSFNKINDAVYGLIYLELEVFRNMYFKYCQNGLSRYFSHEFRVVELSLISYSLDEKLRFLEPQFC